MTVGGTVKRLREQRGWTMGQLASRAAVSTGYLSRLERDFYASPGTTVIQRLAVAFGVQPEMLLDDNEPRPIPLAGRISRTEDLDLPVYRSHAGRLILADPTPLDHWRIRADRTYTIEVVGNCLFGLQISEGDWLLVDRESQAVNGKIVVVRIGDETFLTRWRRLNGTVELEMSDGQRREALVHDVDVQGVVTKVIKAAP